MSAYEYKVIPAPLRGTKAMGVKGADGKFAHALEDVLNAMAADGWEYQRAETLPSEERSGLTSKTSVFRNLLIFRRPVTSQEETEPQEEPELLPAPEPEEPKIPEQEQTSEEQSEQATETRADAS